MFKRLFSIIEVEDLGKKITVKNIDTKAVQKAISKHWGSSTIPQYLITDIKRGSFSIDAFFAPDFLFTLNKLIEQTDRDTKISKKTLLKLKEELLENTWLGRTIEDYPSRMAWIKLDELKFVPKDYQMEFLKAYDQLTQKFRLNGFLLNGAAGSGKTGASLMLAHILDKERVIIVAPKNAIYQVWQSHMERVFKTPQSFWIADQGVPYKGEKYLIVHYEKLGDLLEIVPKLVKKDTVVILDECHNLNSLDSLRTGMFLSMCSALRCTNVLWMSGTPFKAMTKEAIPLFRSIDPNFNADVEIRFKKIYKDTHDRGVEIIRNRLGLVSFKIEKKELKLLPPIFEDVKIKIPKGERYTLANIKLAMQKFVVERLEHYNATKVKDSELFYMGIKHHEEGLLTPADKHAYAGYQMSLNDVLKSQGDFSAAAQMKACNYYELKYILPKLPPAWKSQWSDVRSAVKYVRLKIQGECLGRILGGLRIDAHVAMVPHIDFLGICDSSEKKTVVFSTFQRVLEAVDDKLKTTELTPLFVYGKYTGQLKQIVDRFRAEEDINPLCATYASLSTAVPLTMADTMILIDVPWRDYILQQAVSRIHRLDADTQTYVYRVELDTGEEPNISTRSADVLAWSQKQIQQLTGLTSPYAIGLDPEELNLQMEGFMLATDEDVVVTPPRGANSW